jgi:L,D-transpeptidase catalytic domain/Sporulation and spore germination/Putative peptidoglycan binding domain
MSLRLTCVLSLLAVVLAATATAASSAPITVQVSFVRQGQLVSVERVVPKGVRPELHALRELVQGPTREERGSGLRTAIREGVRPRSVRHTKDSWFVSFSRSLFGPGSVQTKRLRLAQVAATLSKLDGPQQHAVVAAEGRLATTLRLGVRPGTWREQRGEKGYVYSVRGVQLRMFQLGYLARGQVTGTFDYSTSQALLAFQGWEDLARTGTVTGETQLALVRAQRPRPRSRSTRHVEIHRDRGVLLMVEEGDVTRAVHTSTGAGGATPTGTFRVYRKERLSWSYPFSVWMPYASYFVGGIAMHEYSSVPEYPASHGCVRLPDGDAERVYRFAELGTTVHVF